MSDKAHQPKQLLDGSDRTVVCLVCLRRGKVVAVEGQKRTVRITIWYAGVSYTGGPYYSAANTCDGA